MRPARALVGVVAAAAWALAGCSSSEGGTPTAPESAVSGVRTLVSGLAVPWGIAFLPDRTALVTERETARILRVAPDGAVTEVQRLPEVTPSGEGGLLGIAVSPRYATDNWVYVYYTAKDDNRIARLHLGSSPQVLLTGIPKSGIHNGGRLAFGPDGLLYAGTGDGSERGRSQDLNSLGGKILRLTPDGRPAPGNPFPGSPVYSYGHRNVQGLAFDAGGQLWASEFGQNEFDEINRIQPGKNYGWPIVEGASNDPRFTPPLVTWPTSQASPSGVAILGNTLYAAALRGERLWQVPLNGQTTGTPVPLLTNQYGRLRAAARAPDNSLWILTSNRDGRGNPTPSDDRILQLTP
jgi:glucose/arabinose dehydrogenase